MPLTVADWLPGIRPHLASALLDERGFRAVERLARQLPGTCLAALEIPLSTAATAGPAGADLSIRIRCPSEAVALTGKLPPGPARDFLERWSENARLRAKAVEIWFEFDLVGAREPPDDLLPAPVICARLARGVEQGWVVDRLLPGLHGGRSLPGPQRSAALNALTALPSSARPLYAFSLRARSSPRVPPEKVPIRLEIFGLGPRDLTPYLARLAGSDLAAERTAQVEALMPLVRSVDRDHLSFDLAPGLQPRIGVELSFCRLPAREPGWSVLFDRVLEVVGAEPAVARKVRRAVWAWPGWSSFLTAPDTWPAAAGAGYCVRSLSHVKVVTRPARDPQAKVYLLLGPWRRRAGSAAC